MTTHEFPHLCWYVSPEDDIDLEGYGVGVLISAEGIETSEAAIRTAVEHFGWDDEDHPLVDAVRTRTRLPAAEIEKLDPSTEAYRTVAEIFHRACD